MQESKAAGSLGRLPLSAAVLAGGESKRMGKNKALLELGGRHLINLIVEKLQVIFTEVFIVTNNPAEMPPLPVQLVGDIITGGEKNALRGIHAALHAAQYPSCFVVACDTPFLSPPLIEYMASFAGEYDLVAPWLDGYYQPLFSFYNKTSLPVITAALKQKRYRIHALYDSLHVKKIYESDISTYDPQKLSFFNINDRDDFHRAETRFLAIRNPEQRDRS